MHKRTKSQKILKQTLGNTGFQLPDLGLSRNIMSRNYKTRGAKSIKIKSSCSPVKNFENIMNRCEKELKKIRSISLKIQNSARKVKLNQVLISKIIYKPLYSVMFLSKEKPKFLNKQLKYQ